MVVPGKPSPLSAAACACLLGLAMRTPAVAVELAVPPPPDDVPFSMLAHIFHGVAEPVELIAQPGAAVVRAAPPNGFADPIAPLEPEDRALLGKAITPKAFAAFMAAYVDRIETYCTTRSKPPAGFVVWLWAHPEIRREFWLALSPQFDDAQGAMRVLDTLRLHDQQAVETHAQLAIAAAVVYDTPDAGPTDRFIYLWGVQDAQFAPPRGYVETFDYLTAERNQAKLAFRTDALPWPVLVHLIDLDVADAELAWALRACDGAQHDVAGLYAAVPFDYDKLDGKATSLGERPYTLANLLRWGGVCVDQAQYTSRVAKCFGVPAMKVGGEGRYGRTSLHSWAGYLVSDHGRPVLEFTGRYDFDYFYTGDVFDPQTRTVVLDREIAMLYDGLSRSYQAYEASQLLTRAAMALVNTDHAAAITLAQAAIDLDACTPNAWRVLAYASGRGLLGRAQGAALLARMMKELAAHPDLTLECLSSFMAEIPHAQVDARQDVFNRANALYAERPDLQIRLRVWQCAELQEAHRERDAIQVALKTLVANGKEGSLVLPLVKAVVEMANAFARTSKDFRIEVVRTALARMEKDFPRTRGMKVAESYEAYRYIVKDLIGGP